MLFRSEDFYDGDVVKATIEGLQDNGVSEPSSSHFHPGVWYTAYEYNQDYSTGAVENRSFHLKGYTEDEERRVFEGLFGRKGQRNPSYTSSVSGTARLVQRTPMSFGPLPNSPDDSLNPPFEVPVSNGSLNVRLIMMSKYTGKQAGPGKKEAYRFLAQGTDLRGKRFTGWVSPDALEDIDLGKGKWARKNPGYGVRRRFLDDGGEDVIPRVGRPWSRGEAKQHIQDWQKSPYFTDRVAMSVEEFEGSPEVERESNPMMKPKLKQAAIKELRTRGVYKPEVYASSDGRSIVVASYPLEATIVSGFDYQKGEFYEYRIKDVHTQEEYAMGRAWLGQDLMSILAGELKQYQPEAYKRAKAKEAETMRRIRGGSDRESNPYGPRDSCLFKALPTGAAFEFADIRGSYLGQSIFVKTGPRTYEPAYLEDAKESYRRLYSGYPDILKKVERDGFRKVLTLRVGSVNARVVPYGAARNPSYEVYNYKTGDSAGRTFNTRQEAEEWIALRRAESPSIRLFWKVRKLGSARNPESSDPGHAVVYLYATGSDGSPPQKLGSVMVRDMA